MTVSELADFDEPGGCFNLKPPWVQARRCFGHYHADDIAEAIAIYLGIIKIGCVVGRNCRQFSTPMKLPRACCLVIERKISIYAG